MHDRARSTVITLSWGKSCLACREQRQGLVEHAPLVIKADRLVPSAPVFFVQGKGSLVIRNCFLVIRSLLEEAAGNVKGGIVWLVAAGAEFRLDIFVS